jgi:hypothetical protein
MKVFSLILVLTGLFFLTGCQQMQQVGRGISAGSQYVAQPVVNGSKKLASATVSGTRAAAAATAEGSRYVADATVAGTKKVAAATVTGAKALAAGATRLVTFGSANRAPAPAPLAPATRPEDGAPLPPAHRFPSSGLMVTEAELGSDATRLEATAVNLAGGWSLNGSEVAYRLPPGADDPTALRVKGTPATATLNHSDTPTPTTASAREIHYHSANQVLTLRGNATLTSSGTTVTATSPGTLLKIHLPTGSISLDGPARWGE